MNTRICLTTTIAALACTLPHFSRAENEIGYIERFALAPDREKVLGELVPGSEDFYYFHALHYQNARNEAKLAEILTQWSKRFPDENGRRRIILNREALLDYDTAPKATLNYLRERLGLHFNHQQEVRDKKPNLPVALDPKRLAREVFEKHALYDERGGLQSLSQEALEALVKSRTPISVPQRRGLLGRIARPDVPGLVDLVLADLNTEVSRGFGEFAIHKALLPEQLEALVKAKPALATAEAFVFTKVRKLAPGVDADVEFNPDDREAWLTRVWNYVKTLPPAFNTLKAHTLHLRLDHDRKRGVYDATLFLEYLTLPRHLGYVHPKWLERATERAPACDLNANLSEPLLAARPVGNDEPLVREYFLALFDRAAIGNPARIGEDLMAPYTDYVRDTWLRPLLAEALITGGHGNAERWASLLPPTEFQRLKDRVDIEFPATNPPLFKPAIGNAPGDDVQFDVILKNTPKVMVKIYEVNTLSYFLTQRRQLNTDMNLDGLVANSEQAHTFDAGPYKRTRHTLKFPDLKGRRGAWVIEIIGGGRSSRALIRNGQWQVIQTTGPSGDLLTVLDENGDHVKDAVAWLDGRKLTPDETMGNRIAVPFTQQPGMRGVVVADPTGAFATLTQFEHHAESYTLDAQFHIEREQLLARRTATLSVRTALMLGESHLAPSLLTEPKLTITSTTLDGISTTREVKDLKLSAGSVLTHEISVPERLAQLTVALSAKVDVISAGGEKRDVSAQHAWTLNGIDRTDATNDGRLSNFGGKYVYELLGKDGEPVADQQIVFSFRHHDFDNTQTVALKTDEKGRIALGPLTGIRDFHGSSPNGRGSQWSLDSFERTWSGTVHAKAGDVIRVPAPPEIADAKAGLAAHVSLLEIRAGTFFADHSAKARAEDGFLVIEGLAAGDYALRLRGERRDITLKVTDGPLKNGWFLGKSRTLEAGGPVPLNITSIETGDTITIKLANVNPFTRVHIAATRFEPGRGLFAGLGGFLRFGVSEGAPARRPNLYSAGREIGDEYRYILERRMHKIFPGNMLTRPGLLLNPWAVRDTDLHELAQQAGQAAGQTRGGRGESLRRAAAEPKPAADPGAPGAAAEANMDFLAESAPVILNLIPDKDGVVKIDRKALGDRQHVQIYAEDPANAVWRTIALTEVPTKFTDLRLLRNLDPVKPFTQKKEVTVLTHGKALTVADVLTGELETYDTLASVHALFATLSGNGHLAKFAWVLGWPKLKDDEKQAKYSEFACHELNFFLSRKDPAFFDKIVKPYLANKKDRTFMDDYLLGNGLAKYAQQAEYAELNAVERALLAQKIQAGAAGISRNLRELWEMIPPNPDEQDRLFETALRGRALQSGADKSDVANALQQGKKEAQIPDLEVAPAPAVISARNGAVAGADIAEGAGNGAEEDEGGGKGAGRAKGPMLRQLAEKARAGHAHDAKAMDKLATLDEADFRNELRDVPAESQRMLGEQRERAQNRKSALEGKIEIDGRGADDGRGDLNFGYFAKDIAARERARARIYYRQLGVTKEWAENNYYHIRITGQDAQLVPVNAFWRDFAKHVADGEKGPFLSPNVAEASRNFTEMMLALAVLDLPFDAPKHTTKVSDGQLTLTAGGPVIAYHKEIKPTAAANAAQAGLLVSQSFFRHGDRYRQEGNEKFEKYVTEEFLTGTVYGANVVVTNPTSSPVKAVVLLQIPQGALPVLGSKATDSRRLRLEPYTTQTFEYAFYFPMTPTKDGDKFKHYPVNVAVGGNSAAGAKPFEFNVVARLTQFDKASWDYVSQYGTDAEMFAFLEQNNLAALNMVRVAWRCKDAAFFKKFTAFLGAHHIWDPTIYSYAVVHNDPATLREWLKRNDAFVNQCGPYLSSKLLLIDPIQRRAYEHLEYSPLVNQRAHRVGSEHRIANPAALSQYSTLLHILAHKPQLDAMDSMSVTYYLFLQDRVEEGLTRFRAVDAKALPTALQHDYFKCYAGFYDGGLAEARGIAAKYSDFPVPRWRKLFGEVTSQLDEIEGKAAAKKADDKPDREKQQSELAATEPTFDFKVENRTIALTHKNLGEVTVNYYLMDPEFSFSSNPFVSTDASRFSIIKPTKSATQALAKDKDTTEIALPAEYAKANVLVEILGAGQRKAQPYLANTLNLAITENYGRLEVRDSANNKPLPKAYVKVYARLKGGTVRFFKDGYTDLRGRFDYASLNGNNAQIQQRHGEPAPANGLDYQMLKPAEIQQVEKLAILILSETNGADTREVPPPRE